MRISKKTFDTWLGPYESDSQVPCLEAINSRIREVHDSLSSKGDTPHDLADVFASFPGSTFFFCQKNKSANVHPGDDESISFSIGHNIFRLSEAGFSATPEEPFYFLLGFAQHDEPPELAKLPKDAFTGQVDEDDGHVLTPAYSEILKCLDLEDLAALQKKFNTNIKATIEAIEEQENQDEHEEEKEEEPSTDANTTLGDHEKVFPTPSSFIPPFLVHTVQGTIDEAIIAAKEREVPTKRVPAFIALEVLIASLNEFNTYSSEHSDEFAKDAAIACKDFFIQLWIACSMIDTPEKIPAIDGSTILTNFRLEGKDKTLQIKNKIRTAATHLLISTTTTNHGSPRAASLLGGNPEDATSVAGVPSINIINKNEDLAKLVNTLTDTINGGFNSSGGGSTKTHTFLTDTQKCLVRLFHAFGDEEATPASMLNPATRHFMTQGKQQGSVLLSLRFTQKYQASMAISPKFVSILQSGLFLMTDDSNKPNFPSFFYHGHTNLINTSAAVEENHQFDLFADNKILTKVDVEKAMYIQVTHPKTIVDLMYTINNMIATFSFLGNDMHDDRDRPMEWKESFLVKQLRSVVDHINWHNLKWRRMLSNDPSFGLKVGATLDAEISLLSDSAYNLDIPLDDIPFMRLKTKLDELKDGVLGGDYNRTIPIWVLKIANASNDDLSGGTGSVLDTPAKRSNDEGQQDKTESDKKRRKKEKQQREGNAVVNPSPKDAFKIPSAKRKYLSKFVSRAPKVNGKAVCINYQCFGRCNLGTECKCSASHTELTGSTVTELKALCTQIRDYQE